MPPTIWSDNSFLDWGVPWLEISGDYTPPEPPEEDPMTWNDATDMTWTDDTVREWAA